MQGKGKRTAEEKVKIVKKYLRGEAGICRAAAEAGVDRETLRGWVMQYEAEGGAAFLPGRRNHTYSREIKLQAVQDVHGARIFHFDTRIFFIFSFGRIERR